jgi:hypothetical protein
MMKTSTFLLLSTTAAAESGFGFNFFSRTNTKNVTLPTSRNDAESNGWMLTNREDGQGLCREGLGIEYTEGADCHSRERPLSLFFDSSSGHLSAFTVRAWFSDESFYNPETWKLPQFGIINEGERYVTITTRDPVSICSAADPSEESLLGDRLIVNIDEHGKGLLIPTTVPETPDGEWKLGACQYDMSRHWAYPLDGDAQSLYGFDHGVHVLPVVPMYSVPLEEKEGAAASGITALAFFTTEEQLTYGKGGIWDATGTPAQLCSGNFCLDADKCEYGEKNSVLHIFFVDQWLDIAQCGAGGSPDCPAYIPYSM